jgi:hypothetical protein
MQIADINTISACCHKRRPGELNNNRDGLFHKKLFFSLQGYEYYHINVLELSLVIN